ncbi:MAG: hypothetical protein IJM30_09925, partial [Thermoguttaceae bacterium]|nr:hypothetical protein [Thermoguttaceae bacterium]
ASQPASLDVATEDYATLATPENLAYTATTDSITLTWDAVEGATGYTVNFDLGGEYTTTETTLTISELAANTSHVVSVIATGENVYASQPASLDVATEDYATLATPENLAYTATTDSITLTWDAVEGATGYTIYFDAGGEYTTTDTTYTIGNLSVNSEYSVAVVATGENVYASQPAALTASTEDYAQLATPTNLAYTATTDSITVTWDAVEGAELYTVCLGDIQDTIAETSYTFTGLEAGTAYEFEVQATADGAYASEAATLIVETEAEPIVEQGIALEDVVNKVYEEDADVAIATIIATNLDNPEVAVTLDGEATDAITIVDGQLVYVGGLELGDYAIVVTATEGEGVFTAEMTLTVAEMTATISLNTYNPIAGQRVVAVIAPNTRANFQWYVGSDEDGWTAIEGANVSYFSAPMGYVGQCLKVEATYVGGKFDGQTLSDQTEVVGRELLNVRILGTENLAVGKKVRTQTVAWNATVDYQWYRVDAEGNETAIEGANASTYVAQVADRFCSLKVVATGNGLWGGEATATTVETVAFSPLSLSITEPVLGDKIFAVMDPADSMTTYQWYVGSEEDGWTEAGASVSSFSVSTACVGKYVKVEATYQRGECAGETYSVVSDAPVSQALTKVNFGKYVPYVGGSVGVYVNPVAANPSYQWYRVEADGDVLIEGATEADYVPTEADVDCYLKVVATSEGIYFGTVEGTTYAPVAAENPVTLSTYDPMLGDTIVATLNPEDATATYQWQYRSEEGRWTAISDATDGYIEPSEEYLGCYLRVIAKYNDGDYAGLSVIGETNSPLAIALDGVEISGDVEIGATLTAVTTPADATAEYQWYRVDAEGVETAIEGATDASYTIAVADRFCYLKVVATGTGAYVGEVEMTVAEAVPFDPISFSTDTPACGHRVSAIMNPVDTFATYQWYVGSEDAGWTAIEGATYSYYSAPVGFIGQYLKVEATYQRGDCESETYSAVTANPLTAGVSQVVLSSTDAYVGVRLGSYTRPVKATVDLQWYRVDGDVETAIDGATDYRYTPTADDIGYVLKLVATGTGSYGGEAFVVTNPVVDPNETPEEVLVAEQDVLATSSSSAITLSNTEPTWGRRVIAALNPSDQFATYQWYAGSDEAGWTAIEGATYSYFSPNVNYVGQCLKVEATTSAGDVVEAQTSKVNFDVTGVAIDEGDQVMVGAAVSAQIVSRRATAEYQWYLVDAEGNETAIEGATDASYTPVMADVDCFLKVVATGLDEFDSTGTYEATTTQAVEFVPVILSTNDPVLGGKIVAKATVDPAFAKFQWSYGSDEAGWTVIEKTRVAYCTPSYAQVGSQMKVTVSYNTGELAGQTFEAVTENIVTRQLTEVALRSDLAFVGNTITVYAKPIGATADYQWYRVDAEGVETEIEGAVEASYVPTDEDAGSTLKVVATGTGAYVGTAEVSTSEIAALDAAFDEIDELDLDLIAKSLV